MIIINFCWFLQRVVREKASMVRGQKKASGFLGKFQKEESGFLGKNAEEAFRGPQEERRGFQQKMEAEWRQDFFESRRFRHEQRLEQQLEEPPEQRLEPTHFRLELRLEQRHFQQLWIGGSNGGAQGAECLNGPCPFNIIKYYFRQFCECFEIPPKPFGFAMRQ